MYQQTIIIGNVGRDAELQYTQQGVAVSKFSVAVNKTTGKGDQKKQSTTWFRVTMWRDLAESITQYVKKGNTIMIVGEIAASGYAAKDGQVSASLELTAREVKFISSANKATSVPNEARSAQSAGSRPELSGDSSTYAGEYDTAISDNATGYQEVGDLTF